MWCGDFPVGFTTVPILFTTHAATGAPVAPSSAFEAADVQLFKDGSATERTSTSGWTMTSPFNTVTGLHRLLIDLTDNDDAGFYAAGHVYTAVLVPDETVDGLAVARVIGQFGIDLATNVLLNRLTTARANLMDNLGDLDAPVSGTSTVTIGQIASAMAAALGSDTYGEVLGVPAADAPLSEKIGWLFALSRNLIYQTNTTQTLRNDGNTGTISDTSVSDDGSTFTRGEWN